MAAAAVAVHLADTGVWACSGEREWSGGTESGLSPLAFVDSGYVAGPGRVTPSPEDLGAVIRRAVAEVAESERSAVHVTAPTRWGTQRREVVAAAAARVTPHVTVWPTAVAAAKAFAAQRDVVAGAEEWLVVESDGAISTVSRVRFEAGAVSVLATDATTAREGDSGATSLVAAMASRPFDAVLVTSGCDADEIGVLTRRFGRLVVHDVEASDLARGLLPPVARVARHPVVRLAPGGPPPTAPAIRRTLGLIAAMVCIVAAATVYTVAGRDDQDPRPVAQTAVQGQELALGNVRVYLPTGWRLRTTEPATQDSSARLEMVAQEGPDRRIIVTQTRIGPGVGFDGVVSELARLIAEGGGDSKFGALEPGIEFGDRTTIGYRESPDVYSHVKWHVIVEHDTQVSVGCQSLVGDWEFLAGECEQLVRTMVIVP